MRRLRTRYDRRASQYLGFLHLGCALICWNYLSKLRNALLGAILFIWIEESVLSSRSNGPLRRRSDGADRGRTAGRHAAHRSYQSRRADRARPPRHGAQRVGADGPRQPARARFSGACDGVLCHRAGPLRRRFDARGVALFARGRALARRSGDPAIRRPRRSPPASRGSRRRARGSGRRRSRPSIDRSSSRWPRRARRARGIGGGA